MLMAPACFLRVEAALSWHAAASVFHWSSSELAVLSWSATLQCSGPMASMMFFHVLISTAFSSSTDAGSLGHLILLFLSVPLRAVIIGGTTVMGSCLFATRGGGGAMRILVPRASRFFTGLKIDGARPRSHIGDGMCLLGARFLAAFSLAVSTHITGDPRGAPMGRPSCHDTSAAAAPRSGRNARKLGRNIIA